MDESGQPIVITMSDIPTSPPCCQRAHEQGYRRGYEHGYRYAIWDVAKIVLFADHLWDQVEHFLMTSLIPWRKRAYGPTDVGREGGPRLRLTTRRPKEFVG
jgi:hypothetical protein